MCLNDVALLADLVAHQINCKDQGDRSETFDLGRKTDPRPAVKCSFKLVQKQVEVTLGKPNIKYFDE